MFAQTLVVRPSQGPFIIVSTVQSTNNYAMAKLHAELVAPGTCILAVEQTAGRGQRGRQWVAAPSQNITMSIVLPAFHHLSFPFLESAIIAISCYDFIKDLGIPNVSVKWPNDIYIGDRKAAGILVENIYRGSEWRASIAGIGMNINQTEFTASAAKPVSLKQVSGREFDLVGLAKKLHAMVIASIRLAKENSADEILKRYNSILYLKDEEVRLKKGAQVFLTRIKGVSASGELLTVDTLEQSFSVGDVEFV